MSATSLGASRIVNNNKRHRTFAVCLCCRVVGLGVLYGGAATIRVARQRIMLASLNNDGIAHVLCCVDNAYKTQTRVAHVVIWHHLIARCVAERGAVGISLV